MNSWKFKRFGGRQIGAVINNAPGIEALEYGWFSKGWRDKAGKKHPPVAVPGHYMARGAVRHGRVRQLYADTAKKALIIGLSETKFRLKKTKMRAARGREILATAPTKKEGVHMFVRKGRLVIRGNVSGVTRAAYKKITNELFLAVSDMFTG